MQEEAKQSKKRKCRWATWTDSRAWQPRGCLVLLAGFLNTNSRFLPPFHIGTYILGWWNSNLRFWSLGFTTWNSTLLGITKRPSLYKSVRHKLFCCFTEINFYNYTTKCHACIFAESIKLSAAVSEIFISILLQLFLKSAGISWWSRYTFFKACKISKKCLA